MPLERYDAVIVDEAQDLSCAMVALVHQLVGDRTDGLTLIGNGQQTIYRGGYARRGRHQSVRLGRRAQRQPPEQSRDPRFRVGDGGGRPVRGHRGCRWGR
ncbi:UvrD-helicase domain-containing protein [Curtobacterium flaccumfaciens]|uniref:UvrD-helicase domain-containing protein n=1 Tax=Curtobacterium flaccumfaciens TaxID=2035 RepID=UPI003EC0E164